MLREWLFVWSIKDNKKSLYGYKYICMFIYKFYMEIKKSFVFYL